MFSDKSSSPDRDEPARQVSEELLRKVSEVPVRHLPDLLFGGPASEPVALERNPGADGVDRSGGSAGARESESATGPPGASGTADLPPVPADDGAGNPVTHDVPAESATAANVVAGMGGSDVAKPADDGAGREQADPVEPRVPVAQQLDAGSDDPGDDAGLADGHVGSTAGSSGSSVASTAQVDESPYAAGDSAPRPVLLVIADSLSYFGPRGGLPADDPRIWPNLVAAELDWDVELVARIGWTCRDAYWALIGDPRVWAAVPRAGAVVFATGGMDSLPSPLPTALRELIRYLRPPAVRRRVRDGYTWLQPRLSKLGRPVALPPRVSIDYLEQSRTSLAQLRPDLPVVGVLPSVHDCEAYGRVHSGREPAVRALREWSAKTAVPLVDLGDAVRDNIFSGDSNPDGIHWGWEGHTAVARAMVKVITEVRSAQAEA
jgi:hypothetical protein